MNLDSLSFALSQIGHIVTNLTKKNYKTSQLEISAVTLVDKRRFSCIKLHTFCKI